MKTAVSVCSFTYWSVIPATVTKPGFEPVDLEDVQVVIGGSTKLSPVLTSD
jgi:hypothetical protein